VLSYAAVIGMEFDWSVLVTATEMEEEPLAEALERLVHRGILKELNSGDTYAFVRVVTLAQAYRDISSSRVRLIHKKTAAAYEKLHPEPTPDVIPEMGRHFHLGGVHDKSLLYNRYAAMLAMNSFSPDAAIHHLERAREDLSALPGDHRVEEAEVLKEIGEQYGAMGDAARADEFYGESLKKLPEEEVALRGLILLSRADAARETDKLGLVHQYCEEAIRLLEKVGHRKGLALAHRNLGRAAFKEELYEVARREIEKAIGLLDPEKDAKDMAHCYMAFANVLLRMPEPADQAKAIEFYKKAIQTLEQLRDYRELARVHNNIAIAMGFSQPRETLKELTEARNFAEKAKDKRLLGWALFNSVEFHLALGEEKEAAQKNAEARQVLSKINDLIGMQQVALNAGILAQRRKDYEEAEKAYLESIMRAESLDYPLDVVEALMHLATMYADWGKKAEAITAVSRIKKIGEDKFNPMNRPSYDALKKQLGI
jgi:tetratricopeptide (TPR) repeat protein